MGCISTHPPKQASGQLAHVTHCVITLPDLYCDTVCGIIYSCPQPVQDSPEDAQKSDWLAHRRVAVGCGRKWCRLAKTQSRRQAREFLDLPRLRNTSGFCGAA